MNKETSRQHLKKYFHDRFVLLMLTVNIFMTLLVVSLTLLNLGDTGNTYIQSYRANAGLSAYKVGGVGQIISFAVFAVVVLIGQFLVSLRFHSIRKQASWTVMILAMLMLVLSLLVSSSLLRLH